jgi:serine/threonine-protein kinase RsbW
MPERPEVTPAPASFHRQLLSRPEDMAGLPDDLLAWAEAREVSARTIRYVNLMLDELISNIARHAYAGSVCGRIELSADYDGARVCLTLRDYGPPFDPLNCLAPETAQGLDEREFGGLGVHFVRKMADHISYRRDGDANEIVFCRRDVEMPSGVVGSSG